MSDAAASSEPNSTTSAALLDNHEDDEGCLIHDHPAQRQSSRHAEDSHMVCLEATIDGVDGQTVAKHWRVMITL